MSQYLETWNILRKTYAKVQRYTEEDLRKYGSTPSQFQILWNLSLEESIPMSNLSKQAACVNSNITSIIGRMEEKGLVKRIQDKKDRRVVRVLLTETGKKLFKKTEANHNAFLEKMLECYTSDELETLNKLLNKLSSHIEKD